MRFKLDRIGLFEWSAYMIRLVGTLVLQFTGGVIYLSWKSGGERISSLYISVFDFYDLRSTLSSKRHENLWGYHVLRTLALICHLNFCVIHTYI